MRNLNYRKYEKMRDFEEASMRVDSVDMLDIINIDKVSLEVETLVSRVGGLLAESGMSISDYVKELKQKKFQDFLLLRESLTNMLSDIQIMSLDVDLQINERGYNYQEITQMREILRALRPDLPWEFPDPN